MRQEEQNIEEVYKEVAEQLNSPSRVKNGIKNLDDFPLVLGKQAIYIVDWESSQVTYDRGLKELLRFDHNKFDRKQAISNFHPEDELLVTRVIRGIVMHCIQEKVSGKGEYLNLTYRLRRSDGTYIKVLRQSSAYEVDERGRLVSNFSLLTDISFISNHNKVEWDIFAHKFDKKLFRENVFHEFANLFTPREKEIISLISNGFSNKQIAAELFISKHTVSTHRKNILAKSQCENAQDLIDFCNRNGIL